MTAFIFHIMAVVSITMSQSEFNAIKEQVEKLVMVEEAVPEVSLDPIEVVVDKKGRVFIPSKVKGYLKLAYLEFELLLDLKNSLAYSKEPPGLRWSHRIKLGVYFDPTLQGSFVDKWAPVVHYEPLSYKNFGANFSVGSTLAGSSLSFKLMKNVDIFAIGGIQYRNASLGGTLGVSFSLN